MVWVGKSTVATAADDRVIRVYSAAGDLLADVAAGKYAVIILFSDLQYTGRYSRKF